MTMTGTVDLSFQIIQWIMSWKRVTITRRGRGVGCLHRLLWQSQALSKGCCSGGEHLQQSVCVAMGQPLQPLETGFQPVNQSAVGIVCLYDGKQPLV